MFESYPLIVIGCLSLSACCCGRVFTAITKSHPQRNEVFRSDLDKCLPNIQDIQCAFVKVRQTCVIGEPHYTSSEWNLFTCLCSPFIVVQVCLNVRIVCRSFWGVRGAVVFIGWKLTLAGVCQVCKQPDAAWQQPVTHNDLPHGVTLTVPSWHLIQDAF